MTVEGIGRDGGRNFACTWQGGSEIFNKYSTGIPRVINRICDKSLMYAFQQLKRLVDDHMVQYIAENEMLALTRGE